MRLSKIVIPILTVISLASCNSRTDVHFYNEKGMETKLNNIVHEDFEYIGVIDKDSDDQRTHQIKLTNRDNLVVTVKNKIENLAGEYYFGQNWQNTIYTDYHEKIVKYLEEERKDIDKKYGIKHDIEDNIIYVNEGFDVEEFADYVLEVDKLYSFDIEISIDDKSIGMIMGGADYRGYYYDYKEYVKYYDSDAHLTVLQYSDSSQYRLDKQEVIDRISNDINKKRAYDEAYNEKFAEETTTTIDHGNTNELYEFIEEHNKK